MYCTEKAKDFQNNTELVEAELRDVAHIKRNADGYQLALQSHQGSTKLSSAKWFNCEKHPVDVNLADDVKILHVYPPPPLHCLSGVFNDIFTILDQTLQAYASTMKATDWSDGCYLKMEAQFAYGAKAVFQGRVHTA